MATNTRERAKKNAETRDKRPQATAKYLRISSSKVIIVLDLIRGKKYEDAVNILANTNKSASPLILKVLHSAAANAESNLNMPKDNLYVAECYAMQGPTFKRMMPRAKGRGDRILKRTSHIRVILDEKLDPNFTKPKKVEKKATEAKQAKATAPKTASKEVAVKPKTTATKATSGTKAKTDGNSVPKKEKMQAKPVPGKGAENPITEEPNSKKPLGTKKETPAKK